MSGLRVMHTAGVYVESIDSVRFFLSDGTRATGFSISRAVLELLAGGALTPDECRAAFTRHRARIRRVAEQEFIRNDDAAGLIKLTEKHFNG